MSSFSLTDYVSSGRSFPSFYKVYSSISLELYGELYGTSSNNKVLNRNCSFVEYVHS